MSEPDQPDLEEDPEEVPAGWYPDPTPHRRPRERLWDGEQWTSWTRPVKEGRVEDAPAGWRIDPADPERERLWTESQWIPDFRVAEAGEPPGEVEDGPAPPRPEFGSAGWYPDEQKVGMQRYWDGQEWTDLEREVPAAPVAMELSPPPFAPAPMDEGAPGEPPVVGDKADGGEETETAAAGVDPVAQIAELARLHEAGALTDAEFEGAKARLLKRI